MVTDKDIKKLEKVFATKGELYVQVARLETKIDRLGDKIDDNYSKVFNLVDGF